jgi:small-conductance mechanosensitive channel
MKSNILEITGTALVVLSAYLINPSIIIGLVGIALIAIGYSRSEK